MNKTPVSKATQELGQALGSLSPREAKKPASVFRLMREFKTEPQKIDALAIKTCRCACNKLRPVEVLKPFWTGIVTGLDNICPGCKTMDWAKMSKMVCLGCSTVVGRGLPSKDPTGFAFVAGRTYHVFPCPRCAEKYKKQLGIDDLPTVVIEKAVHDKQIGRKHNVNVGIAIELARRVLSGNAGERQAGVGVREGGAAG